MVTGFLGPQSSAPLRVSLIITDIQFHLDLLRQLPLPNPKQIQLKPNSNPTQTFPFAQWYKCILPGSCHLMPVPASVLLVHVIVRGKQGLQVQTKI